MAASSAAVIDVEVGFSVVVVMVVILIVSIVVAVVVVVSIVVVVVLIVVVVAVVVVAVVAVVGVVGFWASAEGDVSCSEALTMTVLCPQSALNCTSPALVLGDVHVHSFPAETLFLSSAQLFAAPATLPFEAVNK